MIFSGSIKLSVKESNGTGKEFRVHEDAMPAIQVHRGMIRVAHSAASINVRVSDLQLCVPCPSCKSCVILYPNRILRLAEHFIAVLEGALILAKAKQERGQVAEHIRHFKRYVQSLFKDDRARRKS